MSHGGGAMWLLLHPHHHQEDCLLSVCGWWGVEASVRSLLKETLLKSQDFLPQVIIPPHIPAVALLLPVFNFSPLIPAIIILVIIYGC